MSINNKKVTSKDNKEKKAAIIILNYNGGIDCIECIKGLDIVSYPHDIFLVDNNSTDDSLALFQKYLPNDVTLIETGANLGYAGGNNIGISRAMSLGYDYICVLNNDTVITEDFLTPCIAELNKNPMIAFISPAIIYNKTGRIQASGSFINPTTGVFKTTGYGLEAKELPKKIVCDYVSGACIVCSGRTIEKTGLIPEAYFLFFEETEWCYRAKKNGFINECLTSYQVRHKGSVSIDKVEGLQFYLMNRNRIAFMRRNTENYFITLLKYKYLCIKAFAQTIKKENRIESTIRLHAYMDGWHKKVDVNKYPFIIIKGD